ncbi:DUF1648 domain-containing protein [Streptomyces qinglanensis]|uniref:DUF1648 domain-containing protein n=1 Tax=Streptomyces qinglanensis TaxID=943816 RepID=A0A1H9N4H1_9ACTN|nr:DUF1648 domain-containing protein [Streptomyces qinglanensis]SER30677.1 Protein of unknown function [Streptomyces qinglanensis]
MRGARGTQRQGDRNGDAPGGARFPWWWLAPGVLVLAGLLVWGIAVYPRLPPQVPQHFGSDGVDRYAEKSVGTVFLPVLVHAGVLALLAGTASATLRITPVRDLPPGRQTSSLVNRPQTARGALRLARAQLFLGCCLGMTIAVACSLMWAVEPPAEGEPRTGALLLALLPSALGTAAVLAAAFRDRRQGSGRAAEPGTE